MAARLWCAEINNQGGPPCNLTAAQQAEAMRRFAPMVRASQIESQIDSQIESQIDSQIESQIETKFESQIESHDSDLRSDPRSDLSRARVLIEPCATQYGRCARRSRALC